MDQSLKKKATRPTLFENFMLLQDNNFFSWPNPAHYSNPNSNPNPNYKTEGFIGYSGVMPQNLPTS